MSIIHSSEVGWIISYSDYLRKIYENVKYTNSEKYSSWTHNKHLFDINSKFSRSNQVDKNIAGDDVPRMKRRKRRKANLLSSEFLYEIKYVKKNFDKLINSARGEEIFAKFIVSDNNEAARSLARKLFLNQSNNPKNFPPEGSNQSEESCLALLNNEEFLLPPNCKYYSMDVREMNKKLPLENQFDFIILDPPWWNKSVRRRKFKFFESSYKMMYNEELMELPIKKLLSTNGLIAIWCTSSRNNLNFILEQLLPAWNVIFKEKWYWVKVTQSGDIVCDFNETHGKQPYELLVIASATSHSNNRIIGGKLIVSVPSAMHSHKPPLIEIMKPYLPENPKCLEIFARYLLPNWTSWGFEVLKFQHTSFFTRSVESRQK